MLSSNLNFFVFDLSKRCCLSAFKVAGRHRYEIFRKEYVIEDLSSPEKIRVGMTGSLQINLLILLKEVRYLF